MFVRLSIRQSFKEEYEYATSILLVCICFGWRNIFAISEWGLKDIWLIFGMGLFVLLSIIAWILVFVMSDYRRIIKIVCYGIASWFLIFNICMPEYWCSMINVKIYEHKYANERLENSVVGEVRAQMQEVPITKKDLDIDYMKTLDLWSIPALLQIKDVKNLYVETGKTVGMTATEAIIEILKKDLNEEDTQTVDNMESDEKMQFLLDELQSNFEYKLPGKKKIMLKLVEESNICTPSTSSADY